MDTLGPFLALGHARAHARACILKATRQRRGEWMEASPAEQGREMARLVDGKNRHCSEAGTCAKSHRVSLWGFRPEARVFQTLRTIKGI